MFNFLLGRQAAERSDYREHVGQDSADAFPRRRPASGHCETDGALEKHLLRREQFEVQEMSLSRDRRGGISE
ncbi:hypothetical protein, partial [Caballeronia zhejiangensis]|uniref:hypothetical protein n=1 Tax=Caballeronia zhejiangensis TaxID=871203 RepID=UPI001F2B59AE